jgi:pilus assembly protein CpaB
MKNTRALVMIGASILIALVAVWLAQKWVTEQGALGTARVAVAATDIDIGSKLTRQMVSVVDWPSSSIPKDAVRDGETAVDRVTNVSLARGEPILLSKLAPEGAQGGLSAIVAKGKRAMTVKVNEVVGVAGFALPGNYVDIIVNTQEEGKSQGSTEDRSVSKIVLERILVLAVAQEANRDETKPKKVDAVTLEVTPEQAEALDLARSVGTLSLVLRNQVDPVAVQTTGATKMSMLRSARAPVPVAQTPAVTPTVAAPDKGTPAPKPAARKPAVAPKAASAPSHCVKVITGTEVSRECF